MIEGAKGVRGESVRFFESGKGCMMGTFGDSVCLNMRAECLDRRLGTCSVAPAYISATPHALM